MPFKVRTCVQLLIYLLAFQTLSSMPSLAHHGEPHEAPTIYSITPQFIQQGQITISVITGINLDSPVIGIIGGGVFGVVLKEDEEGNSITVQFAAQPDAELGDKEFFIRNEDGLEARFPITVIPSGAPTVENINPNNASPGSTVLLYILGMALNNPVITTPSDKFLINSYRASSDGSVLYLSVSLTPDIVPGVYQIFVNTIGGQTQADFIVSNNQNKEEDSFNADPYSPWVNAIEPNPENNNQFILRGSMFNADPEKNIVTILENINGTVTSRQVEVVSSNNDEIIINLPEKIVSNSISFAVATDGGRPSNIKSIDLDSLTTTTDNDNNQLNDISGGSIQNTATATVTNTTSTNQIINSGTLTLTENTQGTNVRKVEPNQQETHKTTEPLPEKPITESKEDINLKQNIQNLTQYLVTNTSNEVNNEKITPSIYEIKDPAKLISAIEENKQIKNQADIIMLALNEAKQNQDLSETVKKSEILKAKVEELEKLLTAEKQKNNPNPRKLAKYQELLENAHTESKSQTFALLNDLLKYKPQLKNLLTQKPFDLAAIQPNIPNDSIILQYVPTEEGLIIFVVDNKNLKVRINKNVSKETLNDAVQEYRQLFENEIEKIKLTGRVTPIISWKSDKSTIYKTEILPLKEKNTFLYNALIAPVEKDIVDKKVVAVIANGWLRYLPFQSLAKPTKEGDLKFLISDKSIVYLDSVIAVSKNKPFASLNNMASITVFANPDGTLSGANTEAETIAKLFNKTTIAHTQKPFNISLINQLAKNADILHLATHGYLDGSNIDSSFLVSGKKQNGKNFVQQKIFLKDIYDLNLNNSKLVVLSGCDTGKLGNLANEPDDIVGSLATAFRVAGANTILASLWKAHDEATKIIMQNFYENLKAGLDKAESLRRAELKVKENPRYGHPLFWSLFDLIGDWR